ncbi:hypothetical protein M9Y10_030117 [Tritrichomonas musculus]|uniref:Surface antigen BspA-like n=1 Tax=Tritrichomonas musculus TaxID=1915356 RepID=A0ABR2KQ62_9EUKA
MFEECECLTTLDIPPCVEDIDTNAFKNCHNLTDITFHYKIAHIGFNSFENCGFKSLEFPDSIMSIGEHAFRHCDSLLSVKLGGRTMTEYGVIDKYSFERCFNLKKFLYNGTKIPPFVGKKAFDESPNLTVIHVIDNIKLKYEYDTFGILPIIKENYSEG